MDLENFEMTYFWQNFNTNLNKILQIKKIKIFFEKNYDLKKRIFPKKQSPKGAHMVPISPFAPN
jgi:hypothetical protein